MNKEVYLLVGLPDNGKYCISNLIINQNGTHINSFPLDSSEALESQSQSLKVERSRELSVIELAGFGDKNYDQGKIFNEFKEALNQVNNKIDCVLFVVSSDRFNNETVKFFDFFQEKVIN